MICLECDADKTLARALGIPRRNIKHMFSKGNVCNRLERNKNSKGLVDEDPLSPQPSYLKKLAPLSEKHKIRLLIDEKRKNRVIVLCPRLEEWILNATKEAKIDISKFNLPDDAKGLYDALNIGPKKLKNFTDLINSLRLTSQMIKTLEELLKSNE